MNLTKNSEICRLVGIKETNTEVLLHFSIGNIKIDILTFCNGCFLRITEPAEHCIMYFSYYFFFSQEPQEIQKESC